MRSCLRSCLLLVLVFALLALTGRWGFAQEADEEQLIGPLRVVTLVDGGEEREFIVHPIMQLDGLRIEVGEDESIITHSAFARGRGLIPIGLEFELDYSQMPIHIDVSIDLNNLVDGPDPDNDSLDMKGIFEFEDEAIRVCLNGDSEGERPEEFASTAENKFLLLTLERIEEEDE